MSKEKQELTGSDLLISQYSDALDRVMSRHADDLDRLMSQHSDYLDKTMSYIGELHSQIVAMGETILGTVTPVMEENKHLRQTLRDIEGYKSESNKDPSNDESDDEEDDQPVDAD